MNQREARKQATRLALAEAAVDLFSSKGFEETRVEDIAAAAGVTSRTFFLHFPSKEEAAFPDHAERVEALASVLAEADPDRDSMPLLRSLVVAGVRDATTSRIRANRRRLFHHIDALRSRDVLGDLDYEDVIADHLAARGRTPFDARRIAVCTMGVARAALTVWVDDRSFDPVAATERALEDIS